MRMMLISAALLALAACNQTTTSAPAEPQPAAEAPPTAMPQTAEEATAQDACGAAQYRSMIGVNIAAATFPADAGIRIIHPDTMVTQDFRPDRLNVIVNADGVITELRCY
jgi:hypothetical protein